VTRFKDDLLSHIHEGPRDGFNTHRGLTDPSSCNNRDYAVYLSVIRHREFGQPCRYR
jgi:hypothetical protein